MTRPPKVSVCLPTLDGERHLGQLLPALEGQRFEGEVELCAVDSSSSDGSLALLEAAGARVECIERSNFQHGRTRNRLVEMARGEICVFLSQDALPANEHFLAELTGAFEDPLTAGASARILPPLGADPLTARTVLADREAAESAAMFEGAEGAFIFNDVASAMRRAVWQSCPFPEIDFGEDLVWARNALKAGHRLRFAPQAVVLHGHRYGPRTAYERYLTDARCVLRETGVGVRPTLGSCLRGVAYELRADARHVLAGPVSGWVHLLRAPFLRTGQILGQYRGSHAGD